MVLVLLIMLGNLRGIRESGTIFMVPTYAYIVVMLALIGYGVSPRDVRRGADIRASARLDAGHRAPRCWACSGAAGVRPGGCAALTGTEAISDGAPAFRPPEWKNARATLTWRWASSWAVLFLGISYLAYHLAMYPAGRRGGRVG